MRVITCQKCGVIKPTPPEDAARGLFPRYHRGKLLLNCICDYCGTELAAGTEAVAISIPKEMNHWEHQYFQAYENQNN